MTAKLYSLTVSPPALAARCMLEHKGIEHRVVDLVPGTQPVALRALGFPRYTVPALRLDGRRIQGSREISRALDELRPAPPLFPRDPDARQRVEEAERWGEQVLQNVPRRIFRWMVAHHYVVRRWLAVEAAHVPLGALLARPPLQARLFARAVAADEAAVRADLAALADHVAEVERLRAAGVIGGAERNAADFQIASSLRSIAKLGDLAPYVDDHPTFCWAATVVPPQPGRSRRCCPPSGSSRSRASENEQQQDDDGDDERDERDGPGVHSNAPPRSAGAPWRRPTSPHYRGIPDVPPNAGSQLPPSRRCRGPDREELFGSRRRE